MSQEVALVDHYERMDKVVQGWLKYGADNTALSHIAREYKIPRTEVKRLVEEWREVRQQMGTAQEAASHALQNYDTTIGMVQKEMWKTYEELTDKGDARNAAGVLKNIADIEAKRQEVYAKAGVYADAELGDQIAETQAMAQAIQNLLTKVARDYPETKTMITEALTEIFGISPMVEMPVKDV